MSANSGGGALPKGERWRAWCQNPDHDHSKEEPLEFWMCGAHTRRGTLCRKPKLKGRARCKLHGGASTGPPPGSRNAMKHGLYSQVFTAAEAQRIEQILEEGDKRLDLSREIATMRFLVERALRSGGQDLEAISRAMDSTRRLMLAQHRIEGQPADALTEAIESMLEEVAEEYGLQ